MHAMSFSRSYFESVVSPCSGAASELIRFSLCIEDANELWDITINDGSLTAAELVTASPNKLCITMSSTIFRECVEGKKTIQGAFFKRQIQVDGSLFTAMKIGKHWATVIGQIDDGETSDLLQAINREHYVMQTECGDTMRGIIGYDDAARTEHIVFIFPPHPLLGGDISNNVVEHICAGITAAGRVAVTFDYPEVLNASQYWQAMTENNDHSELVRDCVAFINKAHAEIDPKATISFVGYSFGAFVALHAARDLEVDRCVLVSLPISVYDISTLIQGFDRGVFITAGKDEFCSEAEVCELGGRNSIPVHTVKNADHFYRGYEQELCVIVVEEIGKKWKTEFAIQ